ncbi:unnamed protein product, partial [Prorocentrum cordatum]
MPLSAAGAPTASSLAALALQGPPSRAATSFARCALPRLWQGPDGIPCRGEEEESCNRVHATCARAPKFGSEPDPDDLRFQRPKPPCEPEPEGEGDGGVAGGLSALATAANAASALVGEGSAGAGSPPANCSARMLDMPYGLANPEATDRDISALSALVGRSPKAVNEVMPNTVWGMAVHGMSGTWAFDSHGNHAADYVYEVPQGKGAPSDFYICDSRTNPKACALIGGNLRHACAENYDARQCDFCEDKGEMLKCTIRGWNAKWGKWSRVPIYPRDLLGELYRGEWRDVMARPMWASVEFRKVDLVNPLKKLPDHMIGDGAGKQGFSKPGPPTQTPSTLNIFADCMPVPPPGPPPSLLPGGGTRRAAAGRAGA